MGEIDPKRFERRAGLPAGRVRRDSCDRTTWITASAALVMVVALIAIPIAVESNLDSPESAATNPTAAAPAIISQDALVAVNAVLAPGVGVPTPDLNSMAKRIGLVGPQAIPVVVAMLCGSVPAPEFANGTQDKPIHPAALACREKVLFASLRQFPAKDVVTHLRRNAPFMSLDERIVFARLLGEVGNLDAQDALIELVCGIEPVQLRRDYVKSTLEDALARCVSGDPAALKALSKATPSIDPTLLPLVARAVGRMRGPSSAVFLARLLEKSAELDVVALQELARVTESSGIALSEDCLAKVRNMLDHKDVNVVRAAISVLGRLCDRDSFGVLARQLEDNDRLVSAAAHWGLHSMTRVDCGETQEAWLVWRDEQDAWWSARSPKLLDNLQSNDAAKVFAALNELNRHPFFKHDSARAIGPLASAPQTSLAISAISALESIGSTQACDALVQSLLIDDARRIPACKALHTLTGLNFPAEYTVWSNALSDLR